MRWELSGRLSSSTCPFHRSWLISETRQELTMNTYLLSPSIHCQSLIIPHRWHLHCTFLPSGTRLVHLLFKTVKHFFFKLKALMVLVTDIWWPSICILDFFCGDCILGCCLGTGTLRIDIFLSCFSTRSDDK